MLTGWEPVCERGGPPSSSLFVLNSFCNIAHRSLRSYFKEKLSSIKIRLEDRLDEYAGNLSGGQRQALNLIIATFSDYAVMLPDEITASLASK